ASPARAGETTVNVGSSTGMAAGQRIQIGSGPGAEARTIADVTNTGATGPRVPRKIGNAVKLSGSGEYVNLPPGIAGGLTDFTIATWVNVTSTDQTWARIFDFGTGTSDFMFLTASAGGTNALRFDINAGAGSQMIPASGSG